MQTQAADALCLQLRVGQVSMVSMPADYLPKRIDWAKWVDGVAMTARVKKNKSTLYYANDTVEADDDIATTADARGVSGGNHGNTELGH
jgi:hypothetical protein